VGLELVGKFGTIARKPLYIYGFTAPIGGIPLRDQAGDILIMIVADAHQDSRFSWVI
jgi:hypothetical protein